MIIVIINLFILSNPNPTVNCNDADLIQHDLDDVFDTSIDSQASLSNYHEIEHSSGSSEKGDNNSTDIIDSRRSEGQSLITSLCSENEISNAAARGDSDNINNNVNENDNDLSSIARSRELQRVNGTKDGKSENRICLHSPQNQKDNHAGDGIIFQNNGAGIPGIFLECDEDDDGYSDESKNKENGTDNLLSSCTFQREEREPTPFFQYQLKGRNKANNDSSSFNELVPNHSAANFEREPTPFFDKKMDELMKSHNGETDSVVTDAPPNRAIEKRGKKSNGLFLSVPSKSTFTFEGQVRAPRDSTPTPFQESESNIECKDNFHRIRESNPFSHSQSQRKATSSASNRDDQSAIPFNKDVNESHTQAHRTVGQSNANYIEEERKREEISSKSENKRPVLDKIKYSSTKSFQNNKSAASSQTKKQLLDNSSSSKNNITNYIELVEGLELERSPAPFSKSSNKTNSSNNSTDSIKPVANQRLTLPNMESQIIKVKVPKITNQTIILTKTPIMIKPSSEVPVTYDPKTNKSEEVSIAKKKNSKQTPQNHAQKNTIQNERSSKRSSQGSDSSVKNVDKRDSTSDKLKQKAPTKPASLITKDNNNKAQVSKDSKSKAPVLVEREKNYNAPDNCTTANTSTPNISELIPNKEIKTVITLKKQAHDNDEEFQKFSSALTPGVCSPNNSPHGNSFQPTLSMQKFAIPVSKTLTSSSPSSLEKCFSTSSSSSQVQRPLLSRPKTATSSIKPNDEEIAQPPLALSSFSNGDFETKSGKRIQKLDILDKSSKEVKSCRSLQFENQENQVDTFKSVTSDASSAQVSDPMKTAHAEIPNVLSSYDNCGLISTKTSFPDIRSSVPISHRLTDPINLPHKPSSSRNSSNITEKNNVNTNDRPIAIQNEENGGTENRNWMAMGMSLGSNVFKNMFNYLIGEDFFQTEAPVSVSESIEETEKGTNVKPTGAKSAITPKRRKSNQSDKKRSSSKGGKSININRKAHRQRTSEDKSTLLSPFEAYTLECVFALCLMTFIALWTNMSVSMFMCYVLAACYTFLVLCVLRVIN